MAKWDTLKKHRDFFFPFFFFGGGFVFLLGFILLLFLSVREQLGIVTTSHDCTLKNNGTLLHPSSNLHHLKTCQSAQWLFYISNMHQAFSITALHLAADSPEVHLFYYSLILFCRMWKINYLGFFFVSKHQKSQHDYGMLSVFLQQWGKQEKLNRKGFIRKGKL